MFADPHVEHDFVMITIDLLLHKLQVALLECSYFHTVETYDQY